MAWLRANSSEHACIVHKQIVEPVENALHNVRSCIEKIKNAVPHTKVELYLTGKGNYRHEVAKLQPYKGNRSAFARPVHYDAIRSYMIDRHNAVVVDGMEADDMLGIRAYELTKESLTRSPVIVTIDKDLDCIEGYHYNWVKEIGYYVDSTQAWRNFFGQCLIGDPTDHIAGIYGIGPAKAVKILAGCSSPSSMLHAVRQAWHKHYPSGYTAEDGKLYDTEEAMLNCAQLLWIKRSRTEDLFNWHFVK